MKSRMLLQVHDELVFECREEEEKADRQLVIDRMQNALALRCRWRWTWDGEELARSSLRLARRAGSQSNGSGLLFRCRCVEGKVRFTNGFFFPGSESWPCRKGPAPQATRSG